MEPVFVMTHGPIKPKPVGLAMSVLRRCKAFASHGIPHTLLVNDHYVSYESSVAALRESGQLHHRTGVQYMHNDLAGDTAEDDRREVDIPMFGSEFTVVHDESNPAISRVYKDNKYVAFIWSEGVRVVFVDKLENGSRTERVTYDSKGYARKVERFGANNRPIQIDYHGRSGNLYLTSHLAHDQGAPKAFMALHTPSGSLSFDSLGDLIGYWLRMWVIPEDSRSTLISEYGFFRRALQDLRRELPDFRVVYTLHNNHFTGSNRYGAPIKPELRDFFDHIDEYDSVVVLTDDQKLDILKQFYPVNNICVIPHHAVMERATEMIREKYRVVILGRYAEHKGQLDAVRAFRRVVDQLPQAQLELYGRGPTEGEIQAEIDSQGLSENVRMMGFSNGSREVYSSASVGLFPTLYEGFGLSIQESMQYGCVPVAYDSKYGIRALIRDGVDGLVIDRGNTDELSDSILLLLRNNVLRETLAENGASVYERFSEKLVVERWTRLFESIHA